MFYLDTAVRFADHDFLLECKILAIWRRFPLIFFSIFYAECPPYFYFRIVWRTDLESIPHASTPTSIIPARFKVDDHTLPSYSVFVCRHVTWPCDLDLEHMSCMASHVSNTATKYEDPTPIRSWVMSYNVSRWLPLKMRTRLLRMRRITWPASRGSKTITFLESPTLICLFTMHLRWLYDEWVSSFLTAHQHIIGHFSAIALRWMQLKLFAKIMHGPVLKTYQFLRIREITWSVKGNLMSYCSRSRRRRFTVLGFKSSAYSRIYGHFQQHLYCAWPETVIYELPV